MENILKYGNFSFTLFIERKTLTNNIKMKWKTVIICFSMEIQARNGDDDKWRVTDSIKYGNHIMLVEKASDSFLQTVPELVHNLSMREGRSVLEHSLEKWVAFIKHTVGYVTSTHFT